VEFGWNEQQNEFRKKVRGFLHRALPEDWWENFGGEGPASPQVMSHARNFGRELADAGLIVPHWPRQYGGEEADPWTYTILGEELWTSGEPRSSLYMGSNWVGPAIMQFGTKEQKDRFLPAIARGEILWCQGFSEPHAGTDLLAMRTRAVAEGDQYVINGSKVWTSYAAHADMCFLLARTAEQDQGKAAISCFLVPMNQRGLEVRPIKAVHTPDDINELFFTDLRVPASARLGEEGKGWDVITTIFHNERVSLPRPAMALKALDRAVHFLKQRGLYDSPPIRAEAASALAACEAARLLFMLVIDGRAKDKPPTADTNIARLAVIAAEFAVLELVTTYLPDQLGADGDGVLRFQFQLGIASGVGAGPAEVQLNMISGRYLGLSRGK
jgi:alkylation response protein AidB-like acyl-CoA dehydrogenase